MNPSPALPPRHRSRGSAFVTVLLYSFLLLTLVATILQWSLSERRMNMRASYFLEARNGAEALAEYGFSQIATQFSSHATVPSFDPQGSSPLAPPPASFFTGGNVDTTAYSTSHPTGIELIGGTVNPVPSVGNALYYVDPNDPNNASDPLKGQYVYRRDIQVISRATVVPPNGDKPVTAFVTEKVSVRGAPLFANAIFYSDNDLEIFPGPQMDIYGPVHCNGNMFVSNQSNATGLLFHGPVSCSGDIYHAWASAAPAGDGSGSEALGSNPVSFITSAGTMVAMKTSGGTWQDSTMGTDSTLFTSGLYTNTTTPALTQLQAKLSSTFRQTASQVWGGNLQTSAMGVSAYNPVGTGGQVGVDGSNPPNPIYANTDAADSLGYGPHSMIDAPNTALSSSDTYYTAKEEVEKQKFSTRAALYVQVTVTPGTSGTPDTATVKLYSWPGSAPNGTPASQVGPNGGILLGTVPSGLVSFIPYQATITNATVAAPATQAAYSATGSGSSWKIKTTTTTGGTLNQSNVTLTYNGSGAVGTSGGSSSYSGGSSSSSTGTTTYSSSANALAAAPGSGATTWTPTGAQTITANTSNANVTSGIYDQRQLAGINLVQVDMSALRAALTDTNANHNTDSKAITDSSNNVWGGSGSSGGYDPSSSGSSGWNGAVYVQVKTSDGSATQSSVALANGLVSSGSNLLPTVNSATGLTVATNAPMYVLGAFNADGTVSSSSATTPDDGKTDATGTGTSAEIPVALASDAITVLSPGYFASAGTNGSSAPATNSSASGGTNAYKSWSTESPSASGNTEIAAAFITGLVPTSSAANSGGAHNLPRFLESWSGDTVAIRGSLVSMYKSKIATGTFSTRYYGAPTRSWGFDKIFQNGQFPPLTPKVMSYRRVDFSDMPASQYATTRHSLWPSLP
jgi:hypothetical protein